MSSMDKELCHLQVSNALLVQMTLWWYFDSPNGRTLQLQLFALEGNILSFPLSKNLACLKSVVSILCPSSASYLTESLYPIHLCCDICYINSLHLFDHEFGFIVPNSLP